MPRFPSPVGLAARLRDLLRPNGVHANLRTWSAWDWSGGGEEWTPDPAWKASFLAHVLAPFVPLGARVLEIGPGGGRWTAPLLDRASHVTAVDLTPACIAACRRRFGDHPRLRLLRNDGRSLAAVPDASIDRLWSFDVFVHLRPADVERYLAQLPRIFAPGARGLLHHARRGRHAPSWRSALTAERMRALCRRHGLVVERQLSTWDDGRASLDGGGDGHDVLTLFRRA